MREIRIQNLDVVYKAEEGNSVLDLNLENDVDHLSGEVNDIDYCETVVLDIVHMEKNVFDVFFLPVESFHN